MILCDACETCDLCELKGCRPITVESNSPRSSIAKTILAAFVPGEVVPNQTLADRTGLALRMVSTHVSLLRADGYLDRIGGSIAPVYHRLSVIRVVKPPHGNSRGMKESDRVIESAKCQPTSVWDLAKEKA